MWYLLAQLNGMMPQIIEANSDYIFDLFSLSTAGLAWSQVIK
jgi:hypothetical protein